MSLTANITHECIDDETITTVELCYNTDACGWKFTPDNVSHKQWSGLAAACRGGSTYVVDNSEGNGARITVGCGTVFLTLCATGNGEGGMMVINLSPEQCVTAFEAAAAATAE